MKVSACLITWKRQENLPKIIANLTQYSFIDEILIRDNSKAEENLWPYGRFVLANQAKNDIIYTQDDDVIVHDIDKLFDEFQKDPTQLVHYGTQGYLDALKTDEGYKTSKLALIGWGSLFDRRWVKPAFDKYLDKYPKDDYFLRLADRIFTQLGEGKRVPFLGNLEHLGGATDGNAMSSQATHAQERLECIRRCHEIISNNTNS